MVKGKLTGAYPRLATSRGIRVIADDSSAGNGLPLDGHGVETKLALTQGFDLPSSPLGDLIPPHRDGLPADAESIGEGLMRPPEVFNYLGKRHHGGLLDIGGHPLSVSMLPSSVKRLTRGGKRTPSKLAYMGGKRTAKDPWAIARGKAMKEARQRLGYSQAKVAVLADVKDRETISQYESGMIVDIDPVVVPKLAKALGLRIEDISRHPVNIRDEAADLRVSSVARQLAYNFDDYPLGLQNAIRHQISSFEQAEKKLGRAAALATYGSAPIEKAPVRAPIPIRKTRSR